MATNTNDTKAICTLVDAARDNLRDRAADQGRTATDREYWAGLALGLDLARRAMAGDSCTAIRRAIATIEDYTTNA